MPIINNQKIKLQTPVDYSGITVPDVSGVQQTLQNFENWRKSQGYRTEEEKQEDLKTRLAVIQERTKDLGEGDSATDWYHAMAADNPEAIAEWDRQAANVTGHGVGAIATIASAGTLGWIPSLVSTAGGYAGGYGGYKLGEAIDNRYGTNTAPWLSLVGGLAGGIGGYKGLVKAGSTYTPTSLGKTMLTGKHTGWWGKQFGKDVLDEFTTQSLKKNTIPYGTVKWYGPTMGKTTAAKTNTNLVDFDDYIRPDLENLASELGMTRQQLMMSQDPTVRERARQLMLKSIDDWRVKPQNDRKTLVISKSDVLQDPIFDNQPLVLKKNTFLQRNAARGETDINNSIDWYNATRRKGGNKLMEWPDETGVYISELEPFTPDPHHISHVPKQVTKGVSSKQLDIEDVLNGADDLPEWTPSLESHPNEFSYYRNNSANYETGKQAVKDYLQSEDYANQIRKNIPNISESELQDIVNKQIDYIDNSNVWLSNANKLEPDVAGETIHTSGYPEIRIYETGMPNYDRMTAKHEWLHAARGPGDSNVNPFWDRLYWNGLIGEGLSRNVGVNKQWYVPANLDLLEFKPHSIDKLTKGETAMMRYLANSDEARVRALKIRDYMNQTGKTYDEVAKIVSDPNAKGSPIGDIHQLFEYFTPESIKNYVDNVMTIGIPVVGGSMIYNKNSKQKEKPIYLQYFGGNIK